jgi:hypothetical protein
VGTPDGELEDEAVSLARGPYDGPVVFGHRLLYLFSSL